MRKDEIIKVTLRLFLSRGYRNVSLNDVADEIGITKGGIYHYFRSKEDLLSQAAEFLFEHIKAKHIALFNNDKSLREILMEILRDKEVERYINNLIGLEHHETFNDEWGLLFEIITLCPDMLQRLERDNLEVKDVIKEKLRKLIDKGEMRADVEVNATSTIIFTIMMGRRTLPFQYVDQNEREQIVENFCKMVSKG
ncbi:MAG: ttgR [Firmicutes bacterium]|nr:ttgR [Bacillota bacterium]